MGRVLNKRKEEARGRCGIKKESRGGGEGGGEGGRKGEEGMMGKG